MEQIKKETTPKTKPVPTTEAAPVKPQPKQSVIDAFKSLPAAERVAMFKKLESAIAHDTDMLSQGIHADNSKYDNL